VQVDDPIKPTVKALENVRLKLKCNNLLSSCAFKFNLCRHTKDSLLLRDTPLSSDISVNLLHVMIANMDLNTQRRSTGPPAEALPRSILSRQPGAYDVLLQLVGGESPRPDCLLLLYRCTRTHLPHPLPWPAT